MLKILILFTLGLTGYHSFALDNCRFPTGKYLCTELNFNNEITRNKDAAFQLAFFSKKLPQKKVLLEQKPKIYLWMVMKNGHAHGSESLQITLRKNSYQVTNVWFLMLGKWDIHIEGSYQGEKFKLAIPVCIKKMSHQSAIGKC